MIAVGYWLLIICYVSFTLKLADCKIGFWMQDILRKDASVERHIYELAEEKNYQIEEHDVITKDGYILKLHRIPQKSKNRQINHKINRPVVFLQHGILACSSIWLIGKEERGLAFVLANAGYDVWMGNARGNTYSRRHKSLDYNSYAFWDFTWHEIGIYDLTAMIDFVLDITNQTQLHYIGHSQGTTTFFVMTSMKPEYNKKIQTMHALSPVAFLANQKSIFFTIPSYMSDFLTSLAKTLQVMELYPNSWMQEYLHNLFCTSRVPFLNACYVVFSMFGGFNNHQPFTDLMPDIMKATPAGASSFQALHFAQIVRNGKFQTYDRGVKENTEKYGHPYPLDYPLENVTSELFFYVSSNDWISTIKDVDTLIEKLPRKPNYIEIEDPNWSHFDYLWGKQAKEKVFDRIVNAIDNTDTCSGS